MSDLATLVARLESRGVIRRRYMTDWGVIDPDPYTNKLLDALEANKPKRRTKTYNTLYKAIDAVIREELTRRCEEECS